MSEKEINEIISRNLTYYLEKNGMTQLDLAERLGVSQAAVSNWCKGIKMPRMNKVDSICDILQIKRSDLMEEHDNSYYIENDAKDIANFLKDNPEYKVLFDASRKVKKDDIERALKAVGIFIDE